MGRPIDKVLEKLHRNDPLTDLQRALVIGAVHASEDYRKLAAGYADGYDFALSEAGEALAALDMLQADHERAIRTIAKLRARCCLLNRQDARRAPRFLRAMFRIAIDCLRHPFRDTKVPY